MRIDIDRRSLSGVALAIVGAMAWTFGVPATAQEAANAEATFNEIVQPVIFSNCQGCHTNGGHAGGLVLNSFETMMQGGSRGPVLVPGDAENSHLFQVINYQDPGLAMPPRGRISQEDIDAVQGWINSLPRDGSAPVTISTNVKPEEKPPAGRPMLEELISEVAETATGIDETSTEATEDLLAAGITREQEQFFENKIRPLLTANCYGCHTRTANGGLRLDSREAILQGGVDGKVVIPGDPKGSMLIDAVHYSGELQMPPTGKLKDAEIAALEEWIADGLPWPETVVAEPVITAKDRQFWSFQTPVKPDVPRVLADWAYNEIDNFILAKLEEKGLKPVGDADKRTLIRRVTYDLTGLPPTTAEVDAFVADQSPDAYKALVERLLASDAYGERWGRKWLDLVRYADTSGQDGDYPIPQAIKYRDYVIKAFNEDKPYDMFVKEQLAGDLLPSENEEDWWENIVATGYLAGTQHVEEREAYITDVVDNLGYTYMGVSVACARCHDHKFDPIPTADYYALYGIVKSTEFPNPGTSNLRYQTGFTYRDRDAMEREDWKIFQKQLEPVANSLAAVRTLPGTYDDLVPQLEVRRMNLFARAPELGESAYAVKEGSAQNVRIQIYGDSKNLGKEAPRGFPQVMGGGPLPEGVEGSGRMELAEWLTSPEHPLTARVMVNRIWQGHFGEGIVSTPNDFGTRGEAPTNQQLLDWLAVEFIENGWSVKDIHRKILMSHAYQLAPDNNEENAKIDPDNHYIWRHSLHRLEAEEVRDSLLKMSGLLDPTPGSVHPFPAAHTWNFEQQYLFEADPEQYETDRRTVYQMVQRTVRPRLYILFDGPATNASSEKRTSSLTPLQALYFMNGEFPERAAEAMTDQLHVADRPLEESVQVAFETVYSRQASDDEMERVRSFLANVMDRYATEGNDDSEARTRAFQDFAKTLFASNEFMFVE